MTTRAQYIRNQNIIRARMEKLYYQKVYEALQSQITEAANIIKRKGVAAAQGNINGSMMNIAIGEVVRELYGTAAKLAIKKYRPNIKAFGFNQAFIDSVIDYFNRYLLTKAVVPISQTTIDFIETILQDAIKEGWGVDETVKRLETSNLTKVRARMIVRTETVKATNFSQLAAADNEKWQMEKMWISIEDKRTRRSHSHAGVDGERIDLYDKFSNGLYYPGDSDGVASEVINCRCTMGYFVKRDLSGNPIPKKPTNINIFISLSEAA